MTKVFSYKRTVYKTPLGLIFGIAFDFILILLCYTNRRI